MDIYWPLVLDKWLRKNLITPATRSFSFIVCVCIPISVTTFPEWLNSKNHCRTHPAPCVVYVVFCVHVYSFAGLIRRTPPPTFSDTAITDHHADTTIFQLRAHWVRISWSIGWEKSFGHVPRWESNLLLSESDTGFYMVCTVRVISPINGDRSHIDRMQNGNILYN